MGPHPALNPHVTAPSWRHHRAECQERYSNLALWIPDSEHRAGQDPEDLDEAVPVYAHAKVRHYAVRLAISSRASCALACLCLSGQRLWLCTRFWHMPCTG
jgi:hypothetical protein